MQRITGSPFIDGNPGTNTKGTIIAAAWLNAVQEELAGTIEGLGGVLDPMNNGQLLAILLARLTSVRGAFKNLSASASGLSATVSVSCDEIILEDSTNNYTTARNVNLSINTTATGVNGLDTGIIAASTWYSTWVIRKPDGTIAGLLSLSATAPTLPTGYTYKARVGWARTDATGNKFPLPFLQYGRRVQYKPAAGTNLTSIPIMASAAATIANTGVAWGAFMPPTSAKLVVDLIVTPSSAALTYASVGPSTTLALAQVGSYQNAVNNSVQIEMIPETSNIVWALTNISTGSGLLMAVGWEDNL